MNSISHSSINNSGFTCTDPSLHRFAMNLCSELDPLNPVLAKLWCYRYESQQYIALDFFDTFNKNLKSITFNLTGYNNFEYEDACLFDTAEALHLVGIITASLQCRIEIGIHNNETNESLLEKSLEDGRTNGKLKLYTITL